MNAAKRILRRGTRAFAKASKRESSNRVYSREFDSIIFKLAPPARELIETKIHDLGSRLGEYPHHRLRGRSEYRLRAGDYRIIYEFDQHQNTLHLITLGHRREIYR